MLSHGDPNVDGGGELCRVCQSVLDDVVGFPSKTGLNGGNVECLRCNLQGVGLGDVLVIIFITLYHWVP